MTGISCLGNTPWAKLLPSIILFPVLTTAQPQGDNDKLKQRKVENQQLKVSFCSSAPETCTPVLGSSGDRCFYRREVERLGPSGGASGGYSERPGLQALVHFICCCDLKGHFSMTGHKNRLKGRVAKSNTEGM